MLRAYLVVCILLFTSIAFAADPEIPVEKRKAIVDAIAKKKPTVDEKLPLRLKSLESAKINAKAKSPEIPDDPTAAPTFQNKKQKDAYEKKLTDQLEAQTKALQAFAENPFAAAPSLKGIDKGEIGFLDHDLCVVGKVLDERQAIITISIINLGGGRNQKLNVLLTGIDTSNLADGKGYRLKGVFYVPGNAKAGGETMMQLVPFTLNSQERSTLGLPEPKTEKK